MSSGPGVEVRPLAAIRKPGGLAALTATSLFLTGTQDVLLVPQTIVPSGGMAPYSFASVNLPAGVTVGAATGIISGTPTVSGNVSSTVTITDSAGTPSTLSLPVFFSLLQTRFSETWAGAKNNLGVDWLEFSPAFVYTSAGSLAQYPNWIRTGTQLRISGVGDANPTVEIEGAALPVKVWQNLYNKPQTFCETTWQGLINTPTNWDAGLCALFNVDLTLGVGSRNLDTYLFFIENGPAMTIYRLNSSGGFTNLATTPGNPVLGDTLRFSADVQVGQVVLTAKKNGITILTATDVAANQIRTGSPGFYFFNCNKAGAFCSIQFGPFSCGIGL